MNINVLADLAHVYEDHARWINLVLLVLCIAGLTANMLIRRRKMNRRTRRVMGWIYAIFINLVYAYSISISQGRPITRATVIATILFTGLLIALLWHPDGDDKRLPDDGSWTVTAVFWLDKHVRHFKSAHMHRKEGNHG